MILNISALSDTWTPLAFSEAHTLYPVLADLDKSGEVRFTSPLAMDLSVRITAGQVEVKGSVSLSIEQACGRCLEPFTEAITTELDLHFVEEGALVQEPTGGDEVELSEEILTQETYNGDRIDLTFCLQDEVVMALPQNPVCNDACKGLCRECGKDLNKGACGCDTTTCHPAFAKLKVLKGGK